MAIVDRDDFKLSEVVTEVGPSSNNLRECFNDSYGPAFDPTYSGVYDRLLNFRNYDHALGPYSYRDERKNTGTGYISKGNASWETVVNDAWDEAHDAISGTARAWPYLSSPTPPDPHVVETYCNVAPNPPPEYWKVGFKRNFLEFDLSAIPLAASCRSARIVLSGGTFPTSYVQGAGHSILWDSEAYLVPVVLPDHGSIDDTDYDAMYFSISSFSNAGGGVVTVTTSAAHGLITGNKVRIFGTANYDAQYVVTYDSSVTFNITATYVSTETGKYLKRLMDSYISSGVNPNRVFTLATTTAAEAFLVQASFGGTLRVGIMSAMDYHDHEMHAYTGETYTYDYYWEFETGYLSTTPPSLRVEWGPPLR